ncbi:MAG: hypothetical protein HYX48_06400 [Chlamydiales bacterium]|nr:hypothetical protein [Chlamydiales bacterium]
MFKSRQHSYADFIEGMLIGGSLAAFTTFMFGTEKGKKLQKELVQKYKKLGHKVERYRGSLERAVKSPAARKLKRAVKKAIESRPARKIARKTARRTARRTRRASR